MIRNLKDLAKHVGAETWGELSVTSRIYKSTKCGVSFSSTMVRMPVRNVERTYTVRWVQSITGWMVASWRQGHGPRRRRADIPKALRLYLDLDARERVAYDPTTIEAPEIIKRTPSPFGGLWMTVRINVQIEKRKSGIYVCGYAENSDAQPAPRYLTYPFTEAEFDAALAAADKDGCDLFEGGEEDE